MSPSPWSFFPGPSPAAAYPAVLRASSAASGSTDLGAPGRPSRNKAPSGAFQHKIYLSRRSISDRTRVRTAPAPTSTGADQPRSKTAPSNGSRPQSQRVPTRRDSSDWTSLLASSGVIFESDSNGLYGNQDLAIGTNSGPSAVDARSCADAVLRVLTNPRKTGSNESHMPDSPVRSPKGGLGDDRPLSPRWASRSAAQGSRPASKQTRKGPQAQTGPKPSSPPGRRWQPPQSAKSRAQAEKHSEASVEKTAAGTFKRGSADDSQGDATDGPESLRRQEAAHYRERRLSVQQRKMIFQNAGPGPSVVARDLLAESESTDAQEKEKKQSKMEAKRFEADLCSFQDLVNAESVPMAVIEALEHLAPVAGGSNFVWERNAKWGEGYGASVRIAYQLILWFHNWDHPDIKTGISNVVSFLHKPGCAYVFQPVLPLTSLMISPRTSFIPMFEVDPRSFHTFKLAWRHFLDFGVSDYRIIVGEQLEQWTMRCKAVIEKPLNAVYWLMLMVGSYYREVLVQRNVLKGFEEPFERIPVICVDSFVSLSALLFSPERQTLYAGTDPTPSYLQWLQYIADQQSRRKDHFYRRQAATVFEMNEFLDLSVIIVFFGRIQQKVRESGPMSWVGNATLIKSYITKYSEDNKVGSQLEQAVRLYTYSCSLGEMQHSAEHGNEEPWYCWNGLKVCEIGVPMPCTQATFLSPFIQVKDVALLCPVHGPDAHHERSKKKPDKDLDKGNSRRPSLLEEQRGVRCSSRSSRRSLTSNAGGHGGSSSKTPSNKGDDDDGKDDGSEWGGNSDDASVFDAGEVFGDSLESSLMASDGGHRHDSEAEEHKQCSCLRYLRNSDSHKKSHFRRKHHNVQPTTDPTTVQALQAIGEFDVMHCFAAVLASGLNHAKQIIRLHFSIDPAAYKYLPMPGRVSWPEGMIPWYREFHRPDAHGRSRYNILLESVVRGLLGDGFTSGYHDEILDILRVSQDAAHELERSEKEMHKEIVSLQMKVPGQELSYHQAPKKNVSINLQGIRRPSSMYGQSRSRSASLLEHKTAEDQPGQQPQLQPQLNPQSPQQHNASTSSAPPAHPPSPHTPHGKLGKGVINDIVLWTELYETESLFNHRSHFETFTQWCHSAHLIPFLKRCYRRSGVAGLLPGQRCGGGHAQADPRYPLVLPTIPNFCYGHCYPLHRVLEYFYGGMQTIVASIDDQQLVEASRAELGLAPGQDRLNNHCWFQLTAQEREKLEKNQLEAEANRVSQHGNLNQLLLQQLEDYISGRQSVNPKDMQHAKTQPLSFSEGFGEKERKSTLSGELGIVSSKSEKLSRLSVGTKRSTTGANATAAAAAMAAANAQQKRFTANSASMRKHASKGGPSEKTVSKRKPHRAPPRPGTLVPEDPFFWFCSTNFALYTFPAESVPRHLLNDGSALMYRYSDFVSRTGTPDPSRPFAPEQSSQELSSSLSASYHRGSMTSIASGDLHDELERGVTTADSKYVIMDHPEVVPPSICLCQPTEITNHVRQRWEVKKDFVDDENLILGDSGWFPGALGQRFSFETKTDDVNRYVHLSTVPQAQLLYVEHTRVMEKPSKQRSAHGPKDLFDSDSSDAESPAEPSKGHRDGAGAGRASPPSPRQRDQQKRERSKDPGVPPSLAIGSGASLMLPPLLSSRGIPT